MGAHGAGGAQDHHPDVLHCGVGGGHHVAHSGGHDLDGTRARASPGGGQELIDLVGTDVNEDPSGRDWIGLKTTNDSILKSVSRVPTFGGFFGLGLLLLALGSMWYREGR